MNTTEGETFLKISGTDSLQADLADVSGFTMPSKTKEMRIEI
jgi:hypothetical protein